MHLYKRKKGENCKEEEGGKWIGNEMPWLKRYKPKKGWWESTSDNQKGWHSRISSCIHVRLWRQDHNVLHLAFWCICPVWFIHFCIKDKVPFCRFWSKSQCSAAFSLFYHATNKSYCGAESFAELLQLVTSTCHAILLYHAIRKHTNTLLLFHPCLISPNMANHHQLITNFTHTFHFSLFSPWNLTT